MAYYPLKVKDNSGNTHVVGDPRTADKADKASPALTGTPTAPTASTGTNTTQIATTAFVQSQIGALTASQIPSLSSSKVPTVDRSVQTGSYTLVLGDAGDLVEMGSASAQTLTIPTNASVAFPIGTKIDILQTGAGECSIAPVDGTVTLNSEGNKRKINAQWQAVALVKRDTNTWALIGALKA